MAASPVSVGPVKVKAACRHPIPVMPETTSGDSSG